MSERVIGGLVGRQEWEGHDPHGEPVSAIALQVSERHRVELTDRHEIDDFRTRDVSNLNQPGYCNEGDGSCLADDASGSNPTEESPRCSEGNDE